MVRAAAGVLVLALLAIVALPAGAAVTLTEFTATARPDNTIRVFWAAATELDTASYQLFRADTAAPTDWGAPIYLVAAGGGVSAASYEHIDRNVTPGVTYWYMLSDISIDGTPGSNGPVQARILLSGETPTNTPTATATLNTNIPTATTGPGFVPTATATLPPPTATRQFTNTPVGAGAVATPFGTPVLSAPTSPVVGARATATIAVAAAVATPTGQALIPTTAPAAVAPTVPPPTVPPPSPTVAIVAQAPGAGLETATLVPTREVTPIIFGASENTTETPVPAQDVAAQGGRNTGGVLAAGGALLGLAGIVAAALLFLRSRKA
jgi:hypothetical protein